MRTKYVLFGLTVVAVGVAYAVTQRHQYKNHPNADAAAYFSRQACSTNTVMQVINAYPPANPEKTPSTPAVEARRDRIFHYDLPKLVEPMAIALRPDKSWDYLHDLGTRSNDLGPDHVVNPDLKKELTLFSKEVKADMEALCPKALPSAAEDQPYIAFAIVTIVESLGNPPPQPKPAAANTASH